MFSFQLAKKLYDSKDGNKASRSAIVIATAGVAVGVLVMVLSLCIAQGFKSEVRSKVASLGGHIQILNAQSMLGSDPKPIQIPQRMRSEIRQIPGVVDVHPFCVKGGMLKTESDFLGIMFRGVGEDFRPTFFRQNLISGSLPHFSADSQPSDSIVISASQAGKLRLKVGDRVYAYFFDKTIRARRFTVAGIYCTYISDFDTKVAFCDLRIAQKLCSFQPDQYSGAEVLVSDFNVLSSASIRVNKVVLHNVDDYDSYYAAPTVTSLYPNIFSWLDLLDTNVWAILILMLSVSGVTMVSGLLIIILERTQFIGTMKALGATNTQIRHIFLWFATLIVIRGIVLGDIVAFILLVLQSSTGIVTLDPTSYYLSHVPVLFDIPGILAINTATLVTCFLVLLVPSYLVSRIHPAKSIRFE